MKTTIDDRTGYATEGSSYMETEAVRAARRADTAAHDAERSAADYSGTNGMVYMLRRENARGMRARANVCARIAGLPEDMPYESPPPFATHADAMEAARAWDARARRAGF